MEIVIIFISLILCFGFFYLLKKYCKNKVQEENLLDNYNELDDDIDLEIGIKQEEEVKNQEEIKFASYISNSTDECSICLEIFKDKKVVQFDCLHKYHLECINDWMKRRNNNIKCPECGI